MARTKSELLNERKERQSSEFREKHHEYLKNTNTFRKYGGVPDSQGKVYDLKLGSSKSKDPSSKGKALARKINSPIAKEKRSLRNDEYEGHQNNWGSAKLARLNRK
jgi:hypothetical protein